MTRTYLKAKNKPLEEWSYSDFGRFQDYWIKEHWGTHTKKELKNRISKLTLSVNRHRRMMEYDKAILIAYQLMLRHGGSVPYINKTEKFKKTS